MRNKNQNRIILHFALSFCILIFVFCIKGIVSAAELNLISHTQEINVGQQFQVNVILNTEGEQINAIEGKIIFPRDLLELKKINDGNSIINFWIEKPKSAPEGQIVFSGIVPGGYNDNQGLILSIKFLAKKEGSGLIEIQNAKTLLNDGKGTEAKLKISNFQFSISKEVLTTQPSVPEIKDLEPPENFKPEIASDPTIFNGKWFLVFATQDKGSGIDHYEVLESRNQKIENRNWRTVESPYLLKDQKLKSFIYVKAIDKAGNERIATLTPRYPLKWYEKWENWIIIIIVTFILYLLWKAIKSKIKYQKSK
jgi:hypothetical protein